VGCVKLSVGWEGGFISSTFLRGHCIAKEVFYSLFLVLSSGIFSSTDAFNWRVHNYSVS